MKGSVLSLDNLLQDQRIERKIRHRLPEPLVLLLEILQSPSLADLQPRRMSRVTRRVSVAPLSISSPTMASLGTGKDIAKQRILAFELVDVVGEQAGDAVRGPLGPARLHIVNLVAQDTLER